MRIPIRLAEAALLFLAAPLFFQVLGQIRPRFRQRA